MQNSPLLPSPADQFCPMEIDLTTLRNGNIRLFYKIDVFGNAGAISEFYRRVHGFVNAPTDLFPKDGEN